MCVDLVFTIYPVVWSCEQVSISGTAQFKNRVHSAGKIVFLQMKCFPANAIHIDLRRFEKCRLCVLPMQVTEIITNSVSPPSRCQRHCESFSNSSH